MIIHSDVMKINKLHKRLNSCLRNLIVVVKNLKNYRQYVNKIVDIVNNVIDRDHERNY